MSSRVNIPQKINDQMMFESDRTCCVCTIPGKAVQIHHIDENNSNSGYENLIVLCLECHSQAHTKGGFGKGLSVGQLNKYKEEWINRVAQRKAEADKLASMYAVTGHLSQSDITNDDDLYYKTAEDFPLLRTYLEKLLLIHRGQQLIAQASWNTGFTFEMIEASTKMIDFYEAVMVALATFYPKGQFDEKHPKIFFAEQIASRITFHAAISDPYKNLGSIERASLSYRIMEEAKEMVSVMVLRLIDSSLDIENEEFTEWNKKWMEDHNFS